MTETSLTGRTIDLARHSARDEIAFAYRPDEAARAAIAADLGLPGLRKARLEGRLVPDGAEDWRLEAELGATAVQACVVTLEPVTTRIDAPVARHYLAAFEEPAETELEMPEDDSREPLPRVIDLDALMREALALELPDFPRAEGAEPVEIAAAPPGVAPMTDEDTRPFAALKALRDGAGDDGES